MKTTTDLRFGEVFRLVDQLQASAEKVQFLNLMNTPNGGVSLLALKEGQALDEHAAPAELFVCVVEGEIDFSVGGQANRLAAGDMLMIGEGVLHSVKCLRDAKVLLCKVRP